MIDLGAAEQGTLTVEQVTRVAAFARALVTGAGG